MCRATLALALLGAAISAPAVLEAQTRFREERRSWKVLRTERFDIHVSDADVEPVALEVGSWLENAYRKLSHRFGQDLPNRIPVTLYRSQSDYREGSFPADYTTASLGAYADTFRDRLRLPLHPSARFMQRLIEHQLAHIFTYHRYFPGSPFTASLQAYKEILYPDWFLEALGDYAADFQEAYTEMILRDAAIDRRLPSLRRLHNFDFLNPHEESEAVALGARAFTIMEGLYGPGAAKRLYHSYRGYLPWPASRQFSAATGDGYARADARIRRALERWAAKQARGKEDPGQGARLLVPSEFYFRVYDTSAAYSPQGGSVAFLTDRNDLLEIFLWDIQAQGTQNLLVWQLKNSIDHVDDALRALGWSPDGRQLAFVGGRKNRNFLCLLDVGQPSAQMDEIDPELDELFSPAFSPDGTRIAFSGMKSGRSDLYVVRLSDRSVERLTHDPYHDEAPSWSPDGRSILYTSERDGQEDLYLVDLETRESARITDRFSNERMGAWSPDGKRIAYVSDEGGIFNLYVLEVATKKVRRVTDVVGGVFGPAWHPEGGKIAFAYYRHQRFCLYEIDVPATHPLTLEAEDQEALSKARSFFRKPIEQFTLEEYETEVRWEQILPFAAKLSDIVQEHEIEIENRFNYSGGRFRTGQSVAYLNQYWRPDLSLTAFHEYSRDDRKTKRSYGIVPSVGLKIDDFHGISLTHALSREQEDPRKEDRSTSGRSSSISLGIVRDTAVRRVRQEISGMRLSLSSSTAKKALGSDLIRTGHGGNWKQFFSLAEDQVLVFQTAFEKRTGADAGTAELADIVRGYRSRDGGGTDSFSTSLEWRFPVWRDFYWVSPAEFLLLKDVRGYVFGDLGFATQRDLVDVFEVLNSNNEDWRHSVGAGIRVDLYVLEKLRIGTGVQAARVTDHHEPVRFEFLFGRVF